MRLAETDNKIRKTIYRTRERKVTFAAKSVAPPRKVHISDNKALQAFYRYQLVSLMTLVGRKEDFINSLRGKKDLMANPLKSN